MPERNSPDPRPSIVPDATEAPAAIAPREAPLPAPPPAAQFTPSGRPLNVPPVVQAIDRVGDIVACIIIGHLCALGKVSGEVAVLAIGAIVGVGTGLRQVGARVGGAGVGLTGLLVLFGARWLAPAAGAAELARASGLFGLLAVLALGDAVDDLRAAVTAHATREESEIAAIGGRLSVLLPAAPTTGEQPRASIVPDMPRLPSPSALRPVTPPPPRRQS